MSTAAVTGLNGRVKKSLAFQLDRLDGILDGLAEALNGAVADAVRSAVGPAAREAVQQALQEAQAQTPEKPPEPAHDQPMSLWAKLTMKLRQIVDGIRAKVKTGFTKLCTWARNCQATGAQIMKQAARSIKSRALAISLLVGSVTTYGARLYHQGAATAKWGAVALLGGIVLVSVMGLPVAMLVAAASGYFLMRAVTSNRDQFASNKRTCTQPLFAAPVLRPFAY